MAAPLVSRQVDFSKGVYANVNRYTQPPGTVRRISNLMLDENGALHTIDGSMIQSSLNGAGATTNQAPFRFIGRYAQSGQAPFLYALQVTLATTNIIDVTNASYSGMVLSAPAGRQTPSFVQAQDFLAFALGAGVTPLLAKGRPLVTSTWTNTWTGSANIPLWFANTVTPQGSPVQPTPANGHIYVALNNGITNPTTQPTFPTGSFATVTDGSVVWQEQGVTTTPPIPPGADFFFYHLGFLWAWGTNPAYINNLDGPDALRMSDLGNFTSWNPLNAEFVGQGDGEVPQGGAVMTLSEAGIAATGQLILFKSNSTYTILGPLTPGTVQSVKVPTGVGCVAPRSIQFIEELGIIRLSSRGIAVFDGQNDTVQQWTDPIKAYLFGSPTHGIGPIDWGNVAYCAAGRVTHPPAYILFCPLPGTTVTHILQGSISPATNATSVNVAFGGGSVGPTYLPFVTTTWNAQWYVGNISATGFTIFFSSPAPASQTVYWAAQQGTVGALTRGFMFDLTLQAWTVVDLPWSIGALAFIPQMPFNSYLLTGGYSDGTIRRIFGDDPDWDGTPIVGNVDLPEYGLPITPGYWQHASINGRPLRNVTCSVTSATLHWMDLDGQQYDTALWVPPKALPVGIDVDTLLISGNLELAFSGPVNIEGVEIVGRPKPTIGPDVNPTFGGNETLPTLSTTQQAKFVVNSAVVGAGQTTLTVQLAVALTSGGNYLAWASPTWATAWDIINQNANGFTIIFGTAPSVASTVFFGAQAPVTGASPANQIATASVAGLAVSKAVTFGQSIAGAYTPVVNTNWNTWVWVGSVSGTGFTAIFATPAPAAGGIVWYGAEIAQ